MGIDQHLFRQLYPRMLHYTLSDGVQERNARTGQKVMTLQGMSFSIYDGWANLLPVDGFRKQYPKSAAAEVAWFLTGSRSLKEAKALGCNFWDKFVEEDGDTISAAYGYRWRKHFGRDQIKLALDALRADKSNRQIVISAWDPSIDGLGSSAKNVPCPAAFTLNVIGEALHSTMFIRSSDLFVGLPYDVMGHAILISVLAESLGLNVGTLSFSLAHAHVYQAHWDMVREGFHRYEYSQAELAKSRHPLELNTAGLELVDVEESPQDLVTDYQVRSRLVSWPTFNPVPEVVA